MGLEGLRRAVQAIMRAYHKTKLLKCGMDRQAEYHAEWG